MIFGASAEWAIWRWTRPLWETGASACEEQRDGPQLNVSAALWLRAAAQASQLVPSPVDQIAGTCTLPL